MLVSRITKTAAAIGALALMSGTAYAGCGSNSLYCNSSSASHSHSASSHSSSYVTLPDTYAASKYGSGSISSSYTLPGSSFSTSSISGHSIAGLGMSERLCPTTCGSNIGVHGVSTGKVVGCYKVCKPAVVQNYVRVVRPIIYVRHPVAVPVPCPTVYVGGHSSRYGGYGHHGYGWSRCGR